jgi:hypothetical protein
MNTIDNSRMNIWQRETFAELPWTPNHAGHSADLALSQAALLGLDNHQATRHVFEMGMDGFFRANQQIPYEASQTVSEDLAHPVEYESQAA